MDITLLLQMAEEGMGTRVALGSRDGGRTVADLMAGARRVAAVIADHPGARVGLLDLNSDAIPLVLFGAAFAGKPFAPLNYRLTDEKLRAIISRTAPAIVVADDSMAARVGEVPGVDFVSRRAVLDVAADSSTAVAPGGTADPDGVAVLLFTSGTTGEPKAAVLRHRNLTSYVLSTVEFAGADETEAALVSVPPYHIAGISAVLSSTYSGRRIVYMEAFEPAAWVEMAEREGITHAMVVPTMLGRILDVVEHQGPPASLRSLSYGGGPMSGQVVERALRLLPHVGFVNAYGLTETSSTIALLGPDDHRAAIASDDPAIRRRLGSVGRPLPSLDVTIRDPEGAVLPSGEIGEIWVRGEQVSGEYLGADPSEATGGWFRTRDSGHLDAGGYLYLHGRLDDVIVRGGENLSPGEIEAVLGEHPSVTESAVVGVPDSEWGERVVAAVTLAAGAQATEEELRDFVRARLRSTKTPDHIKIRAELPHNEMGKLLRRVIRDDLAAELVDR